MSISPTYFRLVCFNYCYYSTVNLKFFLYIFFINVFFSFLISVAAAHLVAFCSLALLSIFCQHNLCCVPLACCKYYKYCSFFIINEEKAHYSPKYVRTYEYVAVQPPQRPLSEILRYRIMCAACRRILNKYQKGVII